MSQANTRLNYLRSIRSKELGRIIPLLKPGGSVLEIGGGAGWQAKELADSGFEVASIDLELSPYRNVQQWDVQLYDGKNIPFDDASFDHVISSNVLEHIPEVEEFQAEILRVLKIEGSAIHILPTFTWRLWANISHFLIFFEKLLRKVIGKSGSTSKPVLQEGTNSNVAKVSAQKKTLLQKLRSVLLPSAHGAVGGAVSELYLFSRFRWSPLFRRTGWQLIKVFPVRLFYTPFLSQHGWPGLGAAEKMSRILGSSCLVYQMKHSDEGSGNQ